MKVQYIVALGLVHLFASFRADAVTEARGNQLEVGPDGSDQVSAQYATYSGAIGQSNTLNAYATLAIGQSNDTSAAWCSLAVGNQNSNRSSSSVTIGYYNYTYGLSNMLFVGYQNGDEAFYPDEGDPFVSANSIIGGSYNGTSAVDSSLVVGQNNSSSRVESGGVIGHGLINIWNHCTVIGQYNLAQYGTSLLFAVGSGTDANNRANAVEVYNDGAVIIPKRQGDIVMGEFGNGNGD